MKLLLPKLSISNWFMHLSLSICFIPSPQLRSSRWVSTLRLPNSLRMEFQSTLPQKLMLMHFTRVSDRMFSLRRLISFKLIYLSRNSLTRSSSSGRISLWSRWRLRRMTSVNSLSRAFILLIVSSTNTLISCADCLMNTIYCFLTSSIRLKM